jgi:arginyl-tRNA synthetase
MKKEQIIKALQKAAGLKAGEIELKFPERDEFGDYTTNIAMILAKKEGKDPKKLAEEIKGKILGYKDIKILCEKIEVASPGFINFWLKKDILIDNLIEIDKEKEKYGSSGLGKGKTVVIDYSSPNIAKPFGIGHLRSTIIGQALYNLYQFLGYKVIGDNHLGDWGAQFGALLAEIQSSKFKVQDLTIAELERMYVDFHKKAESNPKLKEEARAWFKKLEDGDSKAREIWQKCVDVSLAEFARIYRLLDVKIDYAYGESFYQNIMPRVFQDAAKAKLAKRSQGALIIEIPGLKVPLMLSKSDEATTYAARDLATIKFRMEKWQPALIIYEIGEEQSFYFRQVFAAARLLGYVGKDVKLVHTKHGLYLGPGGKKFSTRKGETIKLEEVLNEAIKRARRIVEKSKADRGLSEAEKEKVARAVGIGAVKYFDLMHHPQTNIVFDWKKMFVLEGNSGPYLQYTVARINSVLAKIRKLKIENSLPVRNAFSMASAGGRIRNLKLKIEELAILRSLIRFPEAVIAGAADYSPNILCNYLYDLASKFNTFYNKHKIIASENEDFRLKLTEACGNVLKKGLNLLGIEAPDRM